MKNRNIWDSIRNAVNGVVFSIDGERNMRVHSIAAAAALALCTLLKVSLTELLFIILSIALVLITELLNTSLEYILDSADHYDLSIKKAKDVSAAAVLIAALFSLVAGYTVFMPKILRFAGVDPESGIHFVIMASAAAALIITFLALSATRRRRT